MSLKSFRGIIKGLTWRFFAAFDTCIVTSFIMFYKTGSVSGVWAIVAGIVGLELFTKTFLYAVHERIWDHPILQKLFT